MKYILENHWLRTRTFAHKGIQNVKKGIVENTLESCIRAVKYGYGIEIDVRVTKDGTVRLLHDSNIKRLTDIDKNYYDLTEEDLKTIKYKNSKCKIATLSSVLNYVKGRVPILIEIKLDKTRRMKKLVKAINGLMINYDGEYAIQSFIPKICTLYRKLNSKVLIGLIAPVFLKKYKFISNIIVSGLLKEYKYDFITYNINLMPNKYIKELKILKLFWNINSKEKENKALNNGGNLIWVAYEDVGYLAPRIIKKDIT